MVDVDSTGPYRKLVYQRQLRQLAAPPCAAVRSSGSLADTVQIIDAAAVATLTGRPVSEVWIDVILSSFGAFVAGWTAAKFQAAFVDHPAFAPDRLLFAVVIPTAAAAAGESGGGSTVVVIGTVLAWHHPTYYWIQRLHWLAVVPTWQRRGVAAALVQAVLNYMSLQLQRGMNLSAVSATVSTATNTGLVYLTTEDFRTGARRLYTAFGFAECKTQASLAELAARIPVSKRNNVGVAVSMYATIWMEDREAQRGAAERMRNHHHHHHHEVHR
jgi:GNAT superfamily N-acetyltransferase